MTYNNSQAYTGIMKYSNPKIAVITPCYTESDDYLLDCFTSVKNQGLTNVSHFFISDGTSLSILDTLPIRHIKLDTTHNDNGNTPRAIGSLLAIAENFDFITYLDADNYYLDNHLASMVDLFSIRKYDVVSSLRVFLDLYGKVIPYNKSKENRGTHIDTSCFMLGRKAFPFATIWASMPKPLSPVCDRVFLQKLFLSGLRVGSTKQKTVAFRSQYKMHYEETGMDLSNYRNLKDLGNIIKDIDAYLNSDESFDECISALGYHPTTESLISQQLCVRNMEENSFF